jgi:hypothetical protein
VPRTGNSAGGNDNAELDIPRLGLDVLSFDNKRSKMGRSIVLMLGQEPGTTKF